MATPSITVCRMGVDGTQDARLVDSSLTEAIIGWPTSAFAESEYLLWLVSTVFDEL